MIRRYGSTPAVGQSYKVRHGAYAVLPRGDQVLLTWQGDPHYELQLPGGGIDAGEGALQALHREVFEETGWRIARPRKLGVFRRFTFMPEYDLWAEKVCHIFTACPVKRLGPPTEPDHLAVWMKPEAAIEKLYNRGDAAFAAQVLRR